MKKVNLFIFLLIICNMHLSAADDWTLKTPNNPPPIRYAQGMTYLGDGQILMFGGYLSAVYFFDTWIYDLNADTWTNKNPATRPSGRYGPGFSCVGDNKVLLFGGRNSTVNVNDTWMYDLNTNTWVSKNPLSPPSARMYSDMVLIGSDKFILFGGFDGNNDLDDTWLYDLSDNTWTNQAPLASPVPARRMHTMSFIGDDKVIMYGGYDGTNELNDTWIYDLSDNTWTNQTPSASPGSARRMHAMSSLGGDKVVIFGGYDGANNLNDTWVYDLSDNTWTQDINTTTPSARSGCKLANTSLDGSNYLVLFGSPNDNDTWTFGGGDYTLPIEESLSVSQLDEFILLPACPNPFNPSTTITYGLDKDSKVAIQIYDIAGRLVYNLLNAQQPQGWHSIHWNGHDNYNNQVTAGIYLVKVTSNNITKTNKLMLIK